MDNWTSNPVVSKQPLKKRKKLDDQKLNDYGITKLINLFRLRPALWDRKSDLFKRRDLKEQAYEEIGEAMGLTAETVKKKLNSIRSTYAAERRKISGRSRRIKFAPTLSWYSNMKFLDEYIGTKITANVQNKSECNYSKTKHNKEIIVEMDMSSEIEESRIYSPRCNYSDERTKMSVENYELEEEENYTSASYSPTQMNHINQTFETEEKWNYKEEPEIDQQEYNENKCRICLEENEEVDWNDQMYDSQLTYKDCYYKYTQLEYDENLSTMLCRNCCKGLEYIDAFIAKAIEAHSELQQKVDLNMIIKADENDIKDETSNFETILVKETEVEPEMQNLTVYEESMEEFITPEDESFNSPEKCSSPITQTNEMEMSIFKGEYLKQRTKQPVCCTICSKVLCSKYEAAKHEKTHIENRERNESCGECGMKFFSKEILKAHMETHRENRKRHKCDFCDKTFYNKSTLNIHRRIHLGQTIRCTLCTKEYCRQVDLDRHMVSHSASKIDSELKIKRKCFVPCKHCGENIRSTSFKSHMAKHMNEPLFKCSVCDKEFFSRKSILKHLKTIHGKASTEIANFIIVYKKNRISHLFMQQYADEEIKF